MRVNPHDLALAESERMKGQSVYILPPGSLEARLCMRHTHAWQRTSLIFLSLDEQHACGMIV